MASPRLPSLLILPPPPTPLNQSSLKAAYAPTLKAALTLLARLPEAQRGFLYLVLPLPGVSRELRLPRSQIWDRVSHATAQLYSLVCAVAAELDINTEGPDGVDVRIQLLSYDESRSWSADSSLADLSKSPCGPIIDLPSLALSKRNWHFVFRPDGELALDLAGQYAILAAKIRPPVEGTRKVITGGISMVSAQSRPSPLVDGPARIHKVVAVGGTFDNIHAGHKLLLTATAAVLQPASPGDTEMRRLVIGVTGDELLKNKKYAEFLQTWKERQDDVVDFLRSIISCAPHGQDEPKISHHDEPVVNGKAVHTYFPVSNLRVECVEIQDPFGPTITDESISALVVSAETRSGGAAVNQKREEKGWHALQVFEVEVLDGQTGNSALSTTAAFDSKISSTAIRKRKAELATHSNL